MMVVISGSQLFIVGTLCLLQESYLDQYVSFLSAQSNHQRVVYLLDTLVTLVTNGTIRSK